MGQMKKIPSFFSGFPCLVCGVDSGPIRWFLVVFFGGFFLASALVAVWAFVSGRMKDQESFSNLAIEAENQGKSHDSTREI